MKKILICILAICLIVAVLPSRAYAVTENAQTIKLENGHYQIVTIEYAEIIAGIKSSTTSGTKTIREYDAFNNLVWTATLSGTFTYDGTSAMATNSSLTVSISNSNYYLVSKSAYTSGDTAYGDFTVGHKVLGVTISTSSESLTLTCDANGNLS